MASTYTFSTNVPQATQLITSTQKPILSNFQAINDWLNVNHVSFDDATNYGRHTFLSLPSQGSNPSTTSTEMSLFCAPSSGSNPYEIYFRYPNNGSIVQLTGSGSGTGASSSGYAYMSDTVFLLWGTATGIVTGANVVTFPTGGGIPPFSQTPYGVYYTPIGSFSNQYAQVYISTITTTNFTLQVPQSNFATSVYWLAIGV